MEYKSNILENQQLDYIQLNSNVYADELTGNVSIGEMQAATFTDKFMVKAKAGNGVNQIVLQHSGNGVPIVGIGQESSHGSLQLRLNSGATQVRLSATNNNYIIPSLGVGGVTSPNAKLHIAGGSLGMFLSNLGDNSAYDSIKMSYTGYNSGTPEFIFTQTSTPGSGIANTWYRFKNTNGVDGTNPNNVANVTIGGKLGVGTDSPNAKLTLKGSGLISQDFFHIEDSGGVRMLEVTSDPAGNASLQVKDTTGVTKSLINSAGNSYLNGGNLGIGTNGPGAKLDIVGSTIGLRIKKPDLSDVLRVYTQGSGVFVNNGNFHVEDNVGIGTTAPNAKLDVQGTQGQLFSVTDDLSGDIFSVADISGVPIMNVNSDGTSYFDGNVGIGTESPGAKLEIYGTDSLRTHFNEGLRVTRETVPTQYGMFNYNAGALNIIAVNTAGTGSVTKFMRSGNGTSLDTSMVIDTNGNVGIGTTIPTNPLTIDFASNGIGNITTSNNSTAWNTSSALFLKGASGSNGLGFGISATANDRKSWIQSGHPDQQYANFLGSLAINPLGGNVGIGTTSPSQKLDVNGYARATSGFVGNSGLSLFGDNSSTNRVFITTGGSVGIGTTSPDTLLQTTNTADGTDYISYEIGNTAVNASNKGGFAIYELGTKQVTLEYYRDGSAITNLSTPYIFTIDTNSQERMRITNAGNVGIGTTDPGYKLDVNGSFRGGGIVADSAAGVFSYNEQPVFYGYLDAYSVPALGELSMVDSGIVSYLPTGEVMRISSDGAVGINTISPDSNAKLNVIADSGSSKAGAHFQGASTGTNYGARAIEVTNVPYGAGIHFNYNTIYGGTACSFRNSSNSQVGTIVIGPSSTAYNTSSDYRLKENIVPITGSIDRLMNLKPSRFNFIEEPDTVVDGFIAHEAKKVVPESVTGEKDEVNPIGEPVYQAIDQGKLVPLLTAALQDAITKIEQLETRIQTLENND